jgi:hypothetical protein
MTAPDSSPPPAPSPATTTARPNCPDCGQALKRVRYEGGYLNRDQWESTSAGDWYCTSCKGTRSGTGFRYFWDRELVAPPASDAPAPPRCDATPGPSRCGKPMGHAGGHT